MEEVTDEPLYRDRVCGIDIGKAGMVATIRVPSDKDPLRRAAEIRSFGIRVVEDGDGMLTGEEVPGSWRDPPFEDVWLATYRRLERLYPGEIPPPPQA